MGERSRCSIISSARGGACVSDSALLRGVWWFSRFYLHFPEDIRCEVPFHTLICHLHFILGEVSVEIFGLLFNETVHLLSDAA